MTSVTAGDLIGASWGVLTRRWAWLLGASVATTAIQVLQKGINVWAASQIAIVAVLALLAVLVQFLVHAVMTRKALEAEGLVEPGIPVRYGQYLLVSVIVTVGAILGAVVLIAPGVMAMLRWFLSTEYVLARGMSATQAMAASRDATRGHRWAMLWTWVAVGIVLGLPYLVGVWAAGGMLQLAQVPMMSALGAARLVWAVAITTISLALSIGVYSVLAGRSDTLSDVFS